MKDRLSLSVGFTIPIEVPVWVEVDADWQDRKGVKDAISKAFLSDLIRKIEASVRKAHMYPMNILTAQ